MHLPINNIFCIGRNYVAHIAELNNEVPSEPLIFLKPNSSVCRAGEAIVLPEFSQNVHYETELVLQIGENIPNITLDNAFSAIHAFAVGLDLTARDVQDVAKAKGLPWTKAKGFRGAACVSDFVEAAKLENQEEIEFSLTLNGRLTQTGNTKYMIYTIPALLLELNQVYGLQAGDLVFTGTPAGVGQLQSGDVLELSLQQGLVQAKFEVK